MKAIFTTLALLICISTKANAQLFQISGNSLHFDGVDDYVQCPVPNVLTDISSNEFTIEMWVKLETTQSCHLLFAQEDPDNFVSINLNSNNQIVFYLFENGVNRSVQSMESIIVGEWTHLAVTWDPIFGRSKIVKNGTEVSYESGVFILSTANDNSMAIGGRNDGVQVFSGEIDEISVYHVLREECEIRSERFGKRYGLQGDLDAFYLFDHGTAGVSNASADFLQDLSFNSNDGALVGFALNGNTSNWIESSAPINYSLTDPFFYASIDPIEFISAISADTYQWFDCTNNIPVIGATSSNFNPFEDDPNYSGMPTDYALIVNEGGCVDTSECYTFQMLSVDEISSAQLKIYPNPSQGYFSIDLPENAEEVRIYSISGQLVQHLNVEGQSELNVNLTAAEGMYVVQVKTQSMVISAKVSLQNHE